MSDIEIVKACAEAMGYPDKPSSQMYFEDIGLVINDGENTRYNPLTNDAQAMALVKKFKLSIEGADKSGDWSCREWNSGAFVLSKDLNRAICEVVAKLKDTQ